MRARRKLRSRAKPSFARLITSSFPPRNTYILREDGSYLLREDGTKFKRERS